jgi:hypothetical protein
MYQFTDSFGREKPTSTFTNHSAEKWRAPLRAPEGASRERCASRHSKNVASKTSIVFMSEKLPDRVELPQGQEHAKLRQEVDEIRADENLADAPYRKPPAWRISESDNAHPDSPLARQRREEQAALDRTEQELAQLDPRDPANRHQRERLRERRIAIEAKRLLYELLELGAADSARDPETNAALQQIRDMIYLNFPPKADESTHTQSDNGETFRIIRGGEAERALNAYERRLADLSDRLHRIEKQFDIPLEERTGGVIARLKRLEKYLGLPQDEAVNLSERLNRIEKHTS